MRRGHSVNSEDDTNLQDELNDELLRLGIEDEMNQALRRMGLIGWNVVWDPEPSEKSRGLILQDERVILISDGNEEAAFETLAHEYLEIRLHAMNKAKNTMVNALLKALEQIFYEEKEREINNLVPFVLNMMREKTEKIGRAHGMGSEKRKR